MLYFSTNLPLLRRRAGYTQEDLAEALNVSRQAVSKWESGQTLPEAATLVLLAGLLDCTLDQLMREELAAEPPEPPSREEGDRALFARYNRHMDRYAVLVALGTILIMAGMGTFLALCGMGVDNGMVLLPLLLLVGAAVGLFIWGGLGHEDFQRQFPQVPDRYTPADRARFRQVYRLGMSVSVGSLLLDAGLFAVLFTLVEGRESLEIWAVALLLLVLAGSIGAIVLLGTLEEKYDLNKYARAAAKLRPPDETR